MIKKSKVTAVIPCCGYGTRVGMKPNESKELLINPTIKQPIIQWHLDLCNKYGLEPLCIVRPEKRKLLTYLDKHKIQWVLYSPQYNEEWMHTIYNNREYYSDKNILLLPDTIFTPKSKIKDIVDLLDEPYDLIFGTHLVKDPSKWGIITPDFLIEKPEADILFNLAWGVIGFKDVEIFKELGYNKKVALKNYATVKLTSFKDLTRGKK
jgi:dTDP-glucose pyrophosphorylase